MKKIEISYCYGIYKLHSREFKLYELQYITSLVGAPPLKSSSKSFYISRMNDELVVMPFSKYMVLAHVLYLTDYLVFKRDFSPFYIFSSNVIFISTTLGHV